MFKEGKTKNEQTDKKSNTKFEWSLIIFAKKLQCFHLNFIKNLKIAWLR